MWELKDIVFNIGIFDVIDIAIVAYVFYKLYQLIKETRAEQLVRGIVILLLATKASEIMQLHVVNWILKNTMTVGMIALLIVFQPELRRVLEYLGRTKFIIKPAIEDTEKVDVVVEEVVQSMTSLARQKIGALLVFERETGINDIIQTGTMMDAKVTRQLLINIFIPNTPLHDGAAVIRGGKIMAAGCFLPLTENKFLNKELGTRHRAGLGISERSDCIALIVSEETGFISLAQNGKLYRDLSEESLRIFLLKGLRKEEESKGFFKKGGIFK
ncbi:MAG: diadenylate cyclase [Peptostreptococcaceae bacterium]|nr:diadenylate cyclase [Peptostreptococcaceae bacterium]